jgi:DNA-binding beta-propeller fold protein YncE
VRRFALIGLVTVVVLVGGKAWADGGGRAETVIATDAGLWTTGPRGVIAVDPVTGRMRETFGTRLSGSPIAGDRRTVWLLTPRRLAALDVRERRVRLRIDLLQPMYSGDADARSVWLASFAADTLVKLDAPTGRRRWTVRVPRSPQAVRHGKGAVWIASIGRWHKGRGGEIVVDGPGVVSRVDAGTGRTIARVLVGRGPTALAFGHRSLWVLNGRGVGADDTLQRINPATNRVIATISVPHWSSAVTCGQVYCWVVSEPKSSGGVVSRIDPRNNHVVRRPIPRSWVPAAITTIAGRVWVADPGVAQLIQINPETLRVTRRVTIAMH